MKDEERFDWSLDELCARAQTSRRTVRYYIQQGLVDRPLGVAKSARYGQRHLEQLLKIHKWQRSGVSLSRIGEMLHEGEEATDTVPARKRGRGSVEVWSHLVIDDGVELNLEPTRAGLTPEEVRSFFKSVMAAWDELKGDKDEK